MPPWRRAPLRKSTKKHRGPAPGGSLCSSGGTWTRSRVLVASGRPGVVRPRRRGDWERALPRRSTAASKRAVTRSYPHLRRNVPPKGRSLARILISEEMFDTSSWE
ncbi:hypothetical protein QE152_g5218 [Popillia japonica]|uniref:Uncharacterized protein n=1 Tax=Popillia japonica TaxID=7064 RepID=A0AAW1MPV7_POPJA